MSPLFNKVPKPLADYAPQTYRRLNPRRLKPLTEELLRLAGPEETTVDAKRLVAEFVIDQVRDAKDNFIGITPEEFSARILQKAGVIADIPRFLDREASLPLISLEESTYVLDFSTKDGLLPYGEWLEHRMLDIKPRTA